VIVTSIKETLTPRKSPSHEKSSSKKLKANNSANKCKKSNNPRTQDRSKPGPTVPTLQNAK